MNKLYVLSFTKCGRLLAERIQQAFSKEEIQLFSKEESAAEWVRRAFEEHADLVFVGAMGIAVRLIAPYLKRKDVDPAVVVLDEQGTYAISVLSGHIGGGNELCRTLAAALGAAPVITTATDLSGKFAVDSWAYRHDCVIPEISRIKTISAAVLREEPIGFCSDYPVMNELPFAVSDQAEIGICVSLNAEKCPFETTLAVVPRIVTIGAGCRKGSDAAAFEAFLLETLAGQKISLQAVKELVSADLKAEEACMKAFSQKYEIPFRVATAEALAEVKGTFSSSELVQRVTGVDNVCERSAVFFSKGQLLLPKTAQNGMTVALAAKDWKCMF